MSIFTVITKGNKVRQYHDIDYLTNVRLTEKDYLMLRECGSLEGSGGNPITWPTDATDGLQAIVDVEAGTLRFGVTNGVMGQTEYVVAEYVAPVTSVPHIFDLIDCWPDPKLKGLPLSAPEGWEWKWFGDDWVLSNGYVGLKHDEWLNYKHGESEPAKPFESFVSVEDCDLSTISHPLGLVTEWPKSMPPQCELETVDGCKWEYVHGKWILSDRLYNREFHEGHWLNYHENKKKYANDHCGDEGIELTYSNPVTAASMLTAALGHMEDRAKTYDAPGGERSMGKTVAAFNTITGLDLTEEQGWLFMEILKQVRSQQGNYRADNYEDMVAYAALRGECAARERGNK